MKVHMDETVRPDGQPETLDSHEEDSAVVSFDDADRTSDDSPVDSLEPSGGEGSGRPPRKRGRRVRWRPLGLLLLAAVVLLLAAGTGYLGWVKVSYDSSQAAAAESVPAATDTTIAILSYKAETAEQTLNAARDRLTGSFRDEYTKLINDVVIPGSKEKRISVTATVPLAASLSASANHAVVLLFVNQTTFVGSDPPTDMASSVRVTLDKQGNDWLVSQFEPV